MLILDPCKMANASKASKRLSEISISAMDLLQEEEERLKPGTHKSVMFKVLKHATVEGMTLQEIISKAVEMGFSHFEEAQKSSLSAVSIKAYVWKNGNRAA